MNADEMFNRSRHLLYRRYTEINTGKVYTYQGVLVAEDDYYYCLYSKENGLQCLSCVGDIEAFGFELNETIPDSDTV